MISYGGVNLTSDAATLAVAEARLSLADLKEWARRSFPGRLATLGLDWLGREERPVYNRLVWPVGASQFAYGHFLCTTADLAILRPQAYIAGVLTALPLVLNDGNPGRSFTASLLMLPPRPLGQCGTAGDQYLLTLVDSRYFWWETAGSVAVTAGVTTWVQLFAAIGTALGVSITVDPIPAAYLNPPADFNTYFEYLPPQLDAAARSVGMKVIVRTDGTVHVVSAATAAMTFIGNLALNPIVAGGLIDLTNDTTSDLGGVLPSVVEVAFPTVDASNNPTGTSTGVAVALSSLSLSQYSGATTFLGQHLLRCSAGAGPSNTAQITALANQMASDWYQWQAARPDVAYNGVCPWVMSGMEDRVEWTHHASALTTRVQRPPWNVRNETGLVSGSGGSVTNYFFNLYVTNLFITELVLDYTIFNITTNITNFNVSGVSKVRFTATAAWAITNFTGAVDGQLLFILNVSGFTLTFPGGNVIVPWGKPWVLQSGREVVLQFSTITNLWSIVGCTMLAGDLGLVNYESNCDRLISGTGVTITPNGDGSVTIAATSAGLASYQAALTSQSLTASFVGIPSFITLAAAGTYLVTAQVDLVMGATSMIAPRVQAQLYDATASSQFGQVAVISNTFAGVTYEDTIPLTGIVVTAGVNHSIQVRATDNTATSSVSGGNLTAVKIG